MVFYLGTHIVSWLERYPYIPWFVSVNVLKNRKSKINGKQWILDSGGFTALLKNGEYSMSEQNYLSIIAKHNPNLAFCQDWMCEPFILEKTGLTIKEHQERTLESYLSMRKYTKKTRPVLQGWEPEDYIHHIKMYKRAGVSFQQLYGIGTICSRNGSTFDIYRIVSAIVKNGCRFVHGFGLKITSLKVPAILCMFVSCDSMAWSYAGRHHKPDCGRECANVNCANCIHFALKWRTSLLRSLQGETNGI